MLPKLINKAMVEVLTNGRTYSVDEILTIMGKSRDVEDSLIRFEIEMGEKKMEFEKLDEKRLKPIPFNFVLKVYKDRQGIPDVSDRFTMTFDGTEMELESRGEERIVIRAVGVEVIAGTFFSYLKGINTYFTGELQYLYENFNAANATRMTVLEEIQFHDTANREFNSIIELLLSYYETILIKQGEYPHAASLIETKTWKQPDAVVDGVAFHVLANPLFAQ